MPEATIATRSAQVRALALHTFHIVMSHCFLLPLGVQVQHFGYIDISTLVPSVKAPLGCPGRSGPTRGAVSRAGIKPSMVGRPLQHLVTAMAKECAFPDKAAADPFLLAYASIYDLAPMLQTIVRAGSKHGVQAKQLGAAVGRIERAVTAYRANDSMRAAGAGAGVGAGVGVGAAVGGGASDAKVSQVRDVLPMHDAAYVRQCLSLKGNDVEATIHALLEGSMPTKGTNMQVALAKAKAPTTADASHKHAATPPTPPAAGGAGAGAGAGSASASASAGNGDDAFWSRFKRTDRSEDDLATFLHDNSMTDGAMVQKLVRLSRYTVQCTALLSW